MNQILISLVAGISKFLTSNLISVILGMLISIGISIFSVQFHSDLHGAPSLLLVGATGLLVIMIKLNESITADFQLKKMHLADSKSEQQIWKDAVEDRGYLKYLYILCLVFSILLSGLAIQKVYTVNKDMQQELRQLDEHRIQMIITLSDSIQGLNLQLSQQKTSLSEIADSLETLKKEIKTLKVKRSKKTQKPIAQTAKKTPAK